MIADDHQARRALNILWKEKFVGKNHVILAEEK